MGTSIKQKTLDLLDADLRDGYDRYMGKHLDDHYLAYEQTIAISPRYWEMFIPLVSPHGLSWVDVKFTGLSAHLGGMSSDDPGVYLFYVRPPDLVHNLPRFVFYVGMSGERGSLRPLHQRLADYLRISSLSKRRSVHKYLQLYYETVYVAYALLSAPAGTLEKIEKALHGVFAPWAGERDLPAEIKGPRKAWKK